MAGDSGNAIDKGSLRAMMDKAGNPGAQHGQPVLQCVQIKPLQGGGGGGQGGDRYRVVFSDTVNFIQSMLATQSSYMIEDGILKRGCFVRLKAFNANLVKGKLILIVIDLEVLSDLGECDKIGEPKALENTKTEEDTKPPTITGSGFYGNKQEQKYQPQEQRLASRPSGPADTSHGTIYPIESISPYLRKFTIKARVTSKSEIKTWHNKNGEGKLFSVNLLDETGEIKATAFNEQCDTLWDVLQEGGVYYISAPCRVQIAKKQYSNLSNDYDMVFERETGVEKAEVQNDVPQVRYNFTSIGNLQSMEKDAIIDTIGILHNVDDASQIVSKTTSKPYDKRELTLVDNTNFSVRLTIWGNAASSFSVPRESVIAFKGLKVSDFGGRSLSLLSSGTMTVDPDIDEAHRLKGWYEAQGRNDTFSDYKSMGEFGGATGRQDTQMTCLQVMSDGELGKKEKPDYFSVKATIIFIRPGTVAYPACISEGCNKKVTQEESGWRCEKCNKVHPKPLYRYILSINVSDHTEHLWLSCFDDVGKLIMGMSADKLMELREQEDDKDAFADAICQTFMFKVRAKAETYEDEERVRYHVVSAAPLNFGQEAAKLISAIKLYD